jgi:hypothetical protein
MIFTKRDEKRPKKSGVLKKSGGIFKKSGREKHIS